MPERSLTSIYNNTTACSVLIEERRRSSLAEETFCKASGNLITGTSLSNRENEILLHSITPSGDKFPQLTTMTEEMETDLLPQDS